MLKKCIFTNILNDIHTFVMHTFLEDFLVEDWVKVFSFVTYDCFGDMIETFRTTNFIWSREIK